MIIDYKAYFSDRTVFDEGVNVQLQLGDDAVPFGLWKAIEHMRRDERALIMMKPRQAFNRAENQDMLRWPPGWDTEDKKSILRKRRVYYEVKLYSWSVKHDLDGDGMLLKSILERGVGYDRPFEYDEVTLDLRVWQVLNDSSEKVYQEYSGLETLMSNTEHISNTTKKVLQSMKTNEKVVAKVRPEFFTERDPEYTAQHGILADRLLILAIEMKALVRVEDVYKDGTVFHKTLVKGNGSASPYADFMVLCKCSLCHHCLL